MFHPTWKNSQKFKRKSGMKPESNSYDSLVFINLHKMWSQRLCNGHFVVFTPKLEKNIPNIIPKLRSKYIFCGYSVKLKYLKTTHRNLGKGKWLLLSCFPIFFILDLLWRNVAMTNRNRHKPDILMQSWTMHHIAFWYDTVLFRCDSHWGSCRVNYHSQGSNKYATCEKYRKTETEVNNLKCIEAKPIHYHYQNGVVSMACTRELFFSTPFWGRTGQTPGSLAITVLPSYLFRT